MSKSSPFLGTAYRDEAGKSYIYFTHHRIQEYLVGKHIGSNINPTGKESFNEVLQKEIGDRLNDTWWRQPIIYTFASLSSYTAELVLDFIKDKVDDRFKADVYLLAKAYSMAPRLRQEFEAAYNKFYRRAE